MLNTIPALSRTLLTFCVDTFHFAVDALDSVVNNIYFVIDGIPGLCNLYSHRLNFVLCQFVKRKSVSSMSVLSASLSSWDFGISLKASALDEFEYVNVCDLG